nr:MAG TPA: hypothetical protein [Caudoviricetes sp.]
MAFNSPFLFAKLFSWAYKVYDHYSEKKEEKAKGKPKEKYIEPVY